MSNELKSGIFDQPSNPQKQNPGNINQKPSQGPVGASSEKKGDTASNANKAAVGALRSAPKRRGSGRTVSNQDQMEAAAAQINKMGNKDQEKKEKDAHEANKHSEEDIRLMKEMIFQEYCSAIIKEPIFEGYEMKVKIYSMSLAEFDFLNQIIFDLKKTSIDEEGYQTICNEKLENLFSAMMLCLQIESIDGQDIDNKLEGIKSSIKALSKAELVGITEDKDQKSLETLKSAIVDRAHNFIAKDSNVYNLLIKIRSQFNTRISELLNKEPLIKKS